MARVELATVADFTDNDNVDYDVDSFEIVSEHLLSFNIANELTIDTGERRGERCKDKKLIYSLRDIKPMFRHNPCCFQLQADVAGAGIHVLLPDCSDEDVLTLR